MAERLLLLGYLLAIIGSLWSPIVATKLPTNFEWLFDPDRKPVAVPTERSVCETDDCKLMAQVIKESMNDNVDPCEDFYEYACGNWPNNNPIPEGENTWDLWSMISEDIDKRVKEILETPSTSDEIFAVRMAKKWYKSCMDTDAIEDQGLEPLISTLDQAGGWPLIMEPDEWDKRSFQWQRVDDHYLRIAAKAAFFDILGFSHPEYGMMVGIDTPHLPPGSYALYARGEPEDGTDESDENNQENSQEEGSQERKIIKRLKKRSANGINEEVQESKRRMKKRAGEHHIFSEARRKLRKNRKETTKMKLHPKEPASTKRRNHGEKKHEAKFERAAPSKNGKRTSGWSKRAQEDDTGDEGSELNDEKVSEGSGMTENDQEDCDDDDEDDETEEASKEEMTDEEVAAWMREEYNKYVLTVAKALAEVKGVKPSEEKLVQDVKNLVSFTTKVAELTMQVTYDDILNKTVGSFQDWCDTLEPQTANGKTNWMRKIRRLFSDAGVDLEDDTTLLVVDGKFLKNLVTLFDETPSETIVNYVHWSFISQVLQATTNEMSQLTVEWLEADPTEVEETPKEEDDEDTPREDPKEERAEWCIRKVGMNDIIAYEYIRRHFPKDIKQTAMDMVDDIETEVQYQVKAADWMDEETRDFILDKLVNLRRAIGYPDWYQNKTAVKQSLRGLLVGPNFFDNYLNLARLSKLNQLEQVEEDFDDMSSLIDPLMLNAFFIPFFNMIAITAVDFQHPFFAYQRPQLINFGIIGFIMAHEVNHGFDNNGHLFDKNGEMTEWLGAMAGAYNRRAECFVEQFNSYDVVKGENLTIEDYGNQTAGENIADTMGLQAVYRAYKRRERICGKPEPALPGLENLTNDQLFFLSFANLWCESGDPETMKKMAQRDVHSPGRLRVIGSVSNSDDFAKVYNCPVDSPMNPKKKCSIWK